METHRVLHMGVAVVPTGHPLPLHMEVQQVHQGLLTVAVTELREAMEGSMGMGHTVPQADLMEDTEDMEDSLMEGRMDSTLLQVTSLLV